MNCEALPASAIADQLNRTLTDNNCVVVTAPPGAGKSTLLPLTMLSALPEGKILMLEPRRLAARQVAERMAWMLGEPVGKTVGYRVRFESKVSADTRIEVLTEGILTRMLVADPMLEGISIVVFDEFHERSIHSDVALALTREAQQVVRDDLRIIIMSATIDTRQLCAHLHAPLVECDGTMHPVDIHHTADLPLHDYRQTIHAINDSILHAWREHEGDILVFLPGEADIRRCQEFLVDALPGAAVCPLYGMLPPSQQRAAIMPHPEGRRKVVLATSIAETSLTIEGIRIVIDTGLHRKMVFDPKTSLSHLETVPISLDMARQRSGRAGRLTSGVCYRLWSRATEHRMAEHRTPEILDADLAPMLLDIAAWGGAEPEQLPWLTPPPHDHLLQASSLLQLLAALDADGHITAHGRQLARLACHPRIAQMLSVASTAPARHLAADIAALMESQVSSLPLRYPSSADVNSLLDELHYVRRQSSVRGAWQRVLTASDHYRHLMTALTPANHVADPSAGYFLAAAYPERIAMQMDGRQGHFRMANGSNVTVPSSDDLSAHKWIAIAHCNAAAIPSKDGAVYLAAPIMPEELAMFTTQRDRVAWDNKQGRVVAEREHRIGNLLLRSQPIHDISRDTIHRIICESLPKWGTSMLDFNDDVLHLQQRLVVAAEWHPELHLPDFSTDAVLRTASDWLTFYIGKATTTTELKKIDLTAALWASLSYDQQTALATIVPTAITLPTGRKAKVEYRTGAEHPIVRVRIQDCFGMQDTPRVDNGTRPVLMELLSPGFKPVQLTQDLRNFWATTYYDVRKELKRRYPKHAWPETDTLLLSQ